MMVELIKFYNNNRDNWLKRLLLYNQDKLSYARILFKYDSTNKYSLSANFNFISYIFTLLEEINLNISEDKSSLLSNFLLNNLQENEIFDNELACYECNDIINFIEESSRCIENKNKLSKNKEYFEQKACIHELILLYIKVNFIFKIIPTTILNLIELLHKNSQARTANNFIYKIYIKHIKNINNQTILLETIREELNLILIKDVKSIKVHETFQKTLRNITTLPFLTNMRLDYVSSGLQLIAITLGDKDLMTFAAVQKAKDLTEVSYMSILNKLKTNYDTNKKEEVSIAIDTFLSNFDGKELSYLKDFIFSKATVKDIVMLIAYSGTLRGFSDDFFVKFKNYINHNLILLNDKCYTDFYKMRKLLITTIYKMIIIEYPGTKFFANWTREAAKIIKNSNNNGFIIDAPHISYMITPNKYKTIKLRTNKININTLKVERKARHNVSFFTSSLDSIKLMNAGGANIIQTLDASIVFFFKQTLSIFSSDEIRIATLFDAFLFSNNFTDDIYSNLPIVKDLLRLSTYLTFKYNVLDKIIEKNDLINKNLQRMDTKKKMKKETVKDFKTYFGNIFSEIDDTTFIFENVFTSRLWHYIFMHRHLWLTKEDKINKNFYLNAFSTYANDTDWAEFNEAMKSSLRLYNKEFSYILAKYNIKEPYELFHKTDNKDLNPIKMNLVIQYMLDMQGDIIQNFKSNMFDDKNSDSLIIKLRNILNNDDFVKF